MDNTLSHGHRVHEGGPTKAPTRARRAVQCLTLFLVVLFFLGALSLIAWLCLHPHLPAFRVQSLSVSNFNLSASQLAAKYDVELKIINPNRKIDLSIDHFGLSVMYRGVPLSTRKAADLSPYLRILRNRESEVEFETDTDGLNDKMRRRIVGNLGGDWSKGVVNFNVKMNVGVKFTAGNWLSKQKVLLVICKNLNVEFTSANGKDTGKLHAGRNTCIVDFE